MKRTLKQNREGKIALQVLGIVFAVLLLSSVAIGVAAWQLGMFDDEDNQLNIFDNDDDNQIDPNALVDASRPIKFILINEFTKAAGASFTCTLYDDTGLTGNILEPAGTSGADGNWTTSNDYLSGTELILMAVSGENDIRVKVTVPQMRYADRENNAYHKILVPTFTVPTADVTCSATPSSTGTALADGGDWNKTVSGNTDQIQFNWNLPTDDEGFISSIDERYTVNENGLLRPLKWNAVLYAKVYGTNYEYVDLGDSWDGSFTLGTAKFYYKVLADVEVQKDAEGSGYAVDVTGRQINGAGSFSFSIDGTSYSGDAADIELSLYVKSDPFYYMNKGNTGPDSYAILTSSPFTIDLVD